MINKQGNPLREAWILCLILGLIMINFPFIHIFNTEQLIFRIPELVLYFFLGWPLSIGVIWFFTRNMEKTPEEQAAEQDRADKTS